MVPDLWPKGWLCGLVMSSGVCRIAQVLPPELQTGLRIRGALAAKPFDPPSRKELVQSAEARQALRFLIQTGETVEVSDEIVLMQDAFRQMREAIIVFIRSKGPATVADLRQALGSSRRVVVPLLERLLDRQRVASPRSRENARACPLGFA